MMAVTIYAVNAWGAPSLVAEIDGQVYIVDYDVTTKEVEKYPYPYPWQAALKWGFLPVVPPVTVADDSFETLRRALKEIWERWTNPSATSEGKGGDEECPSGFTADSLKGGESRAKRF
jgi:hypothetical protein